VLEVRLRIEPPLQPGDLKSHLGLVPVKARAGLAVAHLRPDQVSVERARAAGFVDEALPAHRCSDAGRLAALAVIAVATLPRLALG
jgi:hypothetical protein